jgi:methyl coenzyme M reductase beta subunit
MSNLKESIGELMTIDGALAVALVDGNSGMMLGSAGSGVDLDVAAAGNTEVVRAKMKTMKALKLNDEIEDILITLGRQYHIIRPVASKPGLFFYIVLDRQRSNLALARRKALDVESTLTI